MTQLMKEMIANLKNERNALSEHLMLLAEAFPISKDDMIGDDVCAANRDQRLICASSDRIAERIREIDIALQRFEEECVLCEDCEKEIPQARLEALPTARCCVHCQERRDAALTGKKTSSTTQEYFLEDDGDEPARVGELHVLHAAPTGNQVHNWFHRIPARA